MTIRFHYTALTTHIHTESSFLSTHGIRTESGSWAPFILKFIRISKEPHGVIRSSSFVSLFILNFQPFFPFPSSYHFQLLQLSPTFPSCVYGGDLYVHPSIRRSIPSIYISTCHKHATTRYCTYTFISTSGSFSTS